MDYLTAKQVIQLEKAGRSIFIYPRKHEVRVDGRKLYNISAGALNKYQYYKKTGVMVK